MSVSPSATGGGPAAPGVSAYGFPQCWRRRLRRVAEAPHTPSATASSSTTTTAAQHAPTTPLEAYLVRTRDGAYAAYGVPTDLKTLAQWAQSGQNTAADVRRVQSEGFKE